MALRAKETFFVGNRKVTRGQLVNPKDDVVKGRQSLFEDPGEVEVPVVEQATRNPGERRRISMPVRGLPGKQTTVSKGGPDAKGDTSGKPEAEPTPKASADDSPAAGLTTKDLPGSAKS